MPREGRSSVSAGESFTWRDKEMLRRPLLNHSLSIGLFHTYPLGLEKTSLLLPPACVCAHAHTYVCMCLGVHACMCVHLCWEP